MEIASIALMWFCNSMLLAEIFVTYTKGEARITRDFKLNYYRVGLIIILQIGAFIVWILE